MNNELPRYLNAAEIKKDIGVSYRRLMELVRAGRVRSCKFGELQQSSRLFRTEDVVNVLDSMASGKRSRIF